MMPSARTSAVRVHLEPFAAAAVLGVVAVLLWNAWVCDDAYITFRVADNLLAGYGPRWNVDERVQAYTNPLWLLLFTPVLAATGDAYAAALLLGVGCSAAALVAARPLSPSPSAFLALCAGAAGSKAFIDYGTSGLENPLSTLLLVAFVRQLVRLDAPAAAAPASMAALTALVATAAVALLNRLDAALLVTPALLALPRVRRATPPRAWLSAYAIGAAPLLLWLAFAALYYGDPLPNTAAAKLNTGWPRPELWGQGLAYLADGARRDPLTALTIGLGAAVGLREPSLLARALALGVAAHLLYVIHIGGDFMSGRFLTAPLVVAALLLLRAAGRAAPPSAPPSTLRRVALALPLLAWLVPQGPIANAAFSAGQLSLDAAVARYRSADDRGICDERAFYYPTSGLAFAGRLSRLPDHPWRALGERSRAQAARRPALPGRIARLYGVVPSVGFAGFYAGPQVHLIDRYALVDAYIAGGPPRAARQRIGHIEREVSDAYLRSRVADRNLLTDPVERARYDDVALRTRAPLLAAGRLQAIARRVF